MPNMNFHRVYPFEVGGSKYQIEVSSKLPGDTPRFVLYGPKYTPSGPLYSASGHLVLLDDGLHLKSDNSSPPWEEIRRALKTVITPEDLITMGA